MIWDWNNPIGLGLFLMMAAATLVLLGLAVWVVSHSAVPGPTRDNRRR